MKLKKILTASFESSLNLQDDLLIQYMEKDTNGRGIYTGRNRFGLRLLAIFLFGINLLLVVITQKGMAGELGSSTLPQPEVNFLPMAFFWILVMIWIIIWWLSKKNSCKAIQTYVTMLNANNFLIWLMLELDLFFVTFFLRPLTVWGIVLIHILFISSAFLLLQRKVNTLNKLLDSNVEGGKVDNTAKKTFQFILRYGGLLIAIYMIWKIFIPDSSGVRTDAVGFIGLIGIWIAMIIAFITAEIYLFLPYLLQGYYKSKYPEEYRYWEDKSREDWYGERNLKKLEKRRDKNE